jgi:hypothetical protein
MRRCVPLIAVLAFAAYAHVSAQGPAPAGVAGARPGTQAPGAPTPGAARPGTPTRDNAQLPQTGTGALRGRVTASPAGTPLRRAQVSLASPDNPQLRRVTMSDADGRFEFTELPAGRYALNASKAGYVGLQYGQRRPYEAGTPVVLADGQTLATLAFALPRGSVLTGRVTDEFNEPMAQAQVQVQRFQYGPDGQRRLATAMSDTTDDRGEFRVFGLMPGEYVVNAGVRTVLSLPTAPNPNEIRDGYPPTFYPGTLNSAEAQPISIGVGEEKTIQFAMLSARMARISGSVRDSQGRPVSSAELLLLSRQGLLSISSVGTVAADGSFSLTGVPPGEYSIEVRPQARDGVVEGASVPVVVGATDVVGLAVTTTRGALVSGRVIWEGTAPRTNPLPIPLRVVPQPVDPTRVSLSLATDPVANGTLAEDGSFQLSGVSGRVFFTLPIPPGWTLKSVTLDGTDITDTPLDVAGSGSIEGLRITLTDKVTNVSGQVVDGRGAAVTGYVVVMQPAEAKEPLIAARHIRTVRPNTDGRFETRGMRPGRYLATAIESLEQGRQFAPEFQEQLRRGAREFTIDEGQSVTLDLRLTPDL